MPRVVPKPLISTGTTWLAGMPVAKAVARLTRISASNACMRSLMIRNSSATIAAAAMSSRGPAPIVWVHPSMTMVLL